MTDVHSVRVRSYNMSRIRSKDTKPEILVRKFLHKNGFRYRLHVKDMPGKPDIVLKKYKTVVFVQGCFWHGHENCKLFVMPKSNTDYWTKKIQANIDKDLHSAQLLKEQGWNVVKVWECQLKGPDAESTLVSLKSTIVGL